MADKVKYEDDLYGGDLYGGALIPDDTPRAKEPPAHPSRFPLTIQISTSKTSTPTPLTRSSRPRRISRLFLTPMSSASQMSSLLEALE
jgi:hypothetical protein